MARRAHKRYFQFLSLSTLLISRLITAAPEINMPAPDFKGQDSNGNIHKLSNYSGKIVILEWTDYECPFVTKHYDSGNMQSLQKEAKDSGMIWLTIASSAQGKQGYTTPFEANKLIKEIKSNATARILDADGTIAKLYDAQKAPHMFIIDKNGKVVYKGAIDNNRSENTESVRTADNYVKQALGQLVTGRQVEKQKTEPYGCNVTY